MPDKNRTSNGLSCLPQMHVISTTGMTSAPAYTRSIYGPLHFFKWTEDLRTVYRSGCDRHYLSMEGQ